MSGERIRLSPIVGALMAASALATILLATVFTLPGIAQILQFDPGQAAQRPWTFLTYAFADPNFLSLGATLLLLAGFGPPLEREMGGPRFLLYYTACTTGTAVLALGLSSITRMEPLAGAHGPALGLATAFWMTWPDSRLVLDPLPSRIRVRTILLLLIVVPVAAALLSERGMVRLAVLGGPAAGYLLFRLRLLRTRRAQRFEALMSPAPIRSLVAHAEARQSEAGTPPGVDRSSPSGRAAEPPSRPAARAPSSERTQAAELDRVLDKISAFGMQSLTAAERQFLNRISERKRKHSQ